MVSPCFILAIGINLGFALRIVFNIASLASLPVLYRRKLFNSINFGTRHHVSNIPRILRSEDYQFLRDDFYAIKLTEEQAKHLIKLYLTNQATCDLVLPTKFVLGNAVLRKMLSKYPSAYRPSIIDFEKVPLWIVPEALLNELLLQARDNPSKWGSIETIQQAETLLPEIIPTTRLFYLYSSDNGDGELLCLDWFYHLRDNMIAQNFSQFLTGAQKLDKKRYRTITAIKSIVGKQGPILNHYLYLAAVIKKHLSTMPQIEAIWQAKLLLGVFQALLDTVKTMRSVNNSHNQSLMQILTYFFNTYNLKTIAPAYLGQIRWYIYMANLHFKPKTLQEKLIFKELDQQYPFYPALQGPLESYVRKWSSNFSAFGGWILPTLGKIRNIADIIACIPQSLTTSIPSGPVLMRPITFPSNRLCKDVICFVEESLNLIHVKGHQEKPYLDESTFIPNIMGLFGFWRAYSIIILTFFKFKHYFPLHSSCIFSWYRQDKDLHRYNKIISNVFTAVGLMEYIPQEKLISVSQSIKYNALACFRGSINPIIIWIILVQLLLGILFRLASIL